MKIISGGQTGADQAGLYAARDNGIETGGFAPAQYMTLDGSNYKLRDIFGLSAVAGGYKMRTGLNVKNSDCTLRFAFDFNSPGERCTLNFIKTHKKPYKDFLLTYPITDDIIDKTISWIIQNKFGVINIAGNAQRKYDVFTPTYDAMYKILGVLKCIL